MPGFSQIARSIHSDAYRADVDGLRAVAVLSVVICHALPGLLPGGFIGVDIFFVISGYLISTILIRDLENYRFSLLKFYDRRIRRIFPALIVILLFTISVGWFVLFRSEFQMLCRHVVASTLFSENLQLWSERSYFDISALRKPLLHLWSLTIEEQFYLVWPLLMYLAKLLRLNFIIMFAVLGVCSFSLNVYEIRHDPTAAYYSPLGRFWELMIGSCLAYLQIDRPFLLRRYRNTQSVVGAVLLAAALIFTTPERNFPGFWALLPTIGTFLLISGGEDSYVNRMFLVVPALVWCGLISYPLYLWHWPILSYAHIVFESVSSREAIALMILAVALSYFTFLYIERPFRTKSVGALKPMALLATMVAVFGCGVLVVEAGMPSRLQGFEAPTGMEWDFLMSQTRNFDRESGMWRFQSERPRQTLFIGDSQIAQYAERIEKSVAANPKLPGVVFAIMGGCIPIENMRMLAVSSEDCPGLRARGFAMAREKRFETIVVGAAWSWYFFYDVENFEYKTSERRLSLKSEEGKAAAISQLEQELTDLVKVGKNVILLMETPAADGMNPASVKARYNGARARLDRSSAFTPNRTVTPDAIQFELRQKLSDVGSRAGAQIIDPFRALCAGKNCRASTETGQPIYKDNSHLNPDWALNHADFIDEATE
jgi:peptidoglycan/LPS O-acetylase OafA/YrhL